MIMIYASCPIKGTLANSVDPDQVAPDQGSTLLALSTEISVNHSNNIKTNQTPLLLEMDESKELRQKNPLSINGLN